MPCKNADKGKYHLDSTFTSVRQARASISALPVNEELKQRCALVLSELATNAVLHAGAPFTLRVQASSTWVRIEVEDASPVLPTLAGESIMGGRGLRIVEALSARWGAERKPPGKVVWAELGPGAKS